MAPEFSLDTLARNLPSKKNFTSLENMPVSQLSYGDEARFVIFYTDNKQWKLPLRPFYERSGVLQEFIKSRHSLLFSHGLDSSGMQLISLLGVNSTEVEEFFNALYNADGFEPAPAPTSLNIVLSVLRLSTLYRVGFLRKRALDHLLLAYPLTLDDWDNRNSRSTFPLCSLGSHEHVAYYATPEETLKVIKTAHDCHAPWVLPSALYECCKYDREKLILRPFFYAHDSSLELLLKILIGYTEQVELTMQEILGFLRMPSSAARKAGCTQILKCADARMETEERALTWSKQWPLEFWTEDAWDDEPTRIMCTKCRSLCLNALWAGRHRVWSRLPEIFKLPSWKELEESKEKEI